MTRDEIVYFIEYHNRVNTKIFDTAALLTDEQLHRAKEFDRESAFDTIRHLVDVDWSWRLFCMGTDVGKTYLWERVPMGNLAETRAAWVTDSAALMDYAHSLDEATMAQELRLPFGEPPRTVPLWQILVHVVNHGTLHRSELARYFTVCGHSPGDMDFF